MTTLLQTLLDGVDAACRWITGGWGGGSTYALARWVFLRAVAAIYLIAFMSLWVQMKGLIGLHGILPAQEYLGALRSVLGAGRFRLAPTIFWLGAGNGALQLACAAGVLGALLVLCDVLPAPGLLVLWGLYLSFETVGQDFLAFQWDVLLLEAGLLAVLCAPWSVVPGRSLARAVPAFPLLLLWWLLFRLTFESGIVKLLSGDPTWRNLTALDYHFWTQPLPTWTAWYAAQLPAWCKKVMVVATYVLEIGFPLLLWGPRWARLAACAGIVFLQLLIFATGNYTFFNLLTIALALLLIDDALWARVLPGRLVALAAPTATAASRPAGGAFAALCAGAALLYAANLKLLFTALPGAGVPRALLRPVAWLEPLRSANGYGLFRVMTTARVEIVIEGSDDGVTWRPYEFKYKPGDPARRPRFVEPHQPRLDWQMWFAALSSYEQTPWVQSLLVRLLQGSPDVTALFAANPFPGHPPAYVRALAYDYRFTTPAERRATGAWWVRTPLGAYSPVVALRR